MQRANDLSCPLKDIIQLLGSFQCTLNKNLREAIGLGSLNNGPSEGRCEISTHQLMCDNGTLVERPRCLQRRPLGCPKFLQDFAHICCFRNRQLARGEQAAVCGYIDNIWVLGNSVLREGPFRRNRVLLRLASAFAERLPLGLCHP
jgi:hypothetical protein